MKQAILRKRHYKCITQHCGAQYCVIHLWCQHFVVAHQTVLEIADALRFEIEWIFCIDRFQNACIK